MIHLIIHTFTSARDSFGNCYHSARITRTADGESILIRDTGGSDNARYFLSRAGIPWEAMYTINEVLPIRQYNALVKGWEYTRDTSEVVARFVSEPAKSEPADTATSNQQAREENALTLEGLIDASSLHRVLDILSTVCHEKSEHVATNWQDEPLARSWSRMGSRLDTAASRASDYGI